MDVCLPSNYSSQFPYASQPNFNSKQQQIITQIAIQRPRRHNIRQRISYCYDYCPTTAIGK